MNTIYKICQKQKATKNSIFFFFKLKSTYNAVYYTLKQPPSFPFFLRVQKSKADALRFASFKQLYYYFLITSLFRMMNFR